MHNDQQLSSVNIPHSLSLSGQQQYVDIGFLPFKTVVSRLDILEMHKGLRVTS